MPVSNAWPERGCSALKRIKTRLRNRLGVYMLQALLMIAINGPPLGTPECKALITMAIEKWQAQKRRRKIPKRNEGESLSSAGASSVSSQIPMAIEKWQAQRRRRTKMPKRNEGESLSTARASSVSSQIQSDATEIAHASVQTDTDQLPIFKLSPVNQRW